jgi:hypothetical protein
MAYDVYWTGYDFVMDIEALEALGIAKERIQKRIRLAKSR